MAYGGRFVDWLRSLTAKTTTIDGTEQVHIDSSGLSQKATLANVIRYGGGSPRNATAGNATVTQTTDGALYLEVAGQTAGNARGTGAFDWQATRTVATNVANGANSAVLCGYSNAASGAQSVVVGGWGNSCASPNSGAFSSIGSSVGANSDGAASVGGQQNTINASSGLSAVVGGKVNTVSKPNTVCLGGQNLLASNVAQVAFGYGVQNSVNAQGSLQTFYTATTDATLTPLNITNTATDRLVIPASRAVTFIGIVTAASNVSSSSNFIKAWKIEGVITRDGSNTTRLVGTPTITEIAKDADGTPTPSTWAIASITADDTNEALAINVTGQAATTIRWQATLMYSQVGF